MKFNFNLKKHKRLVGVFFIILFLLAALSAVLLLSSNNENRITLNELSAYSIEYQSQYERLCAENNALTSGINDFSNFTFFQFHKYNAEGFISNTHGAALYFDPFKKTSEYKLISEPIEYNFWPKMTKNTNNLPVIKISEGDYYLDSTVSSQYGLLYVDPQANMRFVVKDASFNFTKNAAIVVFGTVILEHSLLLKGSNNKADWSIAQADLDALNEFVWDLKSANVNDNSTSELKTRYEVLFLLSKIGSRMQADDYRSNPSIFYSDYEQLKKATAGTMNETLTNVLNDFYQNQQETTPTLGEQINVFFTQTWFGALILGLVVSVIWLIIKLVVKPKRKSSQSEKSNLKKIYGPIYSALSKIIYVKERKCILTLSQKQLVDKTFASEPFLLDSQTEWKNKIRLLSTIKTADIDKSMLEKPVFELSDEYVYLVPMEFAEYFNHEYENKKTKEPIYNQFSKIYSLLGNVPQMVGEKAVVLPKIKMLIDEEFSAYPSVVTKELFDYWDSKIRPLEITIGYEAFRYKLMLLENSKSTQEELIDTSIGVYLVPKAFFTQFIIEYNNKKALEYRDSKR